MLVEMRWAHLTLQQTDADMAEQAELTHVGDNNEKPFWKQYTLFHAAWAQFCYTGAQGEHYLLPLYLSL